MLSRILLLPIAAVVCWSGTGNLLLAQPPQSSPEDIEFFEQRIRPVLVDHCYECHSATSRKLKGDLMLDNRAAIEKGGDSGIVLVPGQPEASRLITAIRYQDDDLQMPPDGRLPDEVISDFERWVRSGAADPRGGPAPQPAGDLAARARKHWAFQVPRKLPRPAVGDAAWPRTEIDFYVLARLEAHGLAPSPEADAPTRVRRLYYDLTGLPPTLEQVQAFAGDPSEAAYARLIDQLLQSPQFGERWARHWLDVSRFGDTKGYVFKEDRNYPNAFKYRDWVIAAINDDMRWDQFLKYQIAADQFVAESDRTHLSALGYLTLGRRFINNKHDIIDDRIDVVFRGMMGLTVGCARCHDHKYDPISTRDYYGIYGVFSSSRDEQDKDLPLRLIDQEKPGDARVFVRGRPDNPGEIARRQFPSFFSGDHSQPFDQGSGRRELAEAIVDGDNPLTSRVFVNRVWSHLMGEGLVRTPSDFGLRSDLPVQQDLLDFLAVTLTEERSVKSLIRTIVSSSVYRQSSRTRDGAAGADSENRLLWRANRKRLDFEAMRDSLLAVSGQLDRTIGGASVRIDTRSPSLRRTLYAFIDRQNLPGIFRTFDFASPDTHSPRRPRTTVPQQPLYLMNNPFVHQAAEAAVARIGDPQAAEPQVRALYNLILAREPTGDEVTLAVDFLESAADETELAGSPEPADSQSPPRPLPPLVRFAQTLMLTNEFMFLD